MTLNDLAQALRGMPRDAPLYIRTPDGLAPLVRVRPTFVSANEDEQVPSAGGRYALVLEAGRLESP